MRRLQDLWSHHPFGSCYSSSAQRMGTVIANVELGANRVSDIMEIAEQRRLHGDTEVP